MNKHGSLPPAVYWAEIFVAALAQAGLRRVVISPGSRSTPLTLAFARRSDIRHYAAIDERGAAFFALGMALTDGQPTALVCTSGTATAEYAPAILEADAAGVPLLVLTADRPHELRHSGANQTTDQVKLYGNHVRWFVDVALPEANPAPRTLRYLRTLAARAWATARGLHMPPGPVHLNFPFRKPLEPSTPRQGDTEELRGAGNTVQAVPLIQSGMCPPTAEQVASLAALIRNNPRGVILCGARSPGGDFPGAVSALAHLSGYPILAEALSGLRFGPHVDGQVLGGYEAYLAEMPTPDLVLRFGALPVGKAALTWLAELPPETTVAHISTSGRWQDENHHLDLLLRADPALTCRALNVVLGRFSAEQTHNWLCAWQQAEQHAWQARKDDWVAALLQTLPAGSNLFVANSLPVRELGEQAPPLSKALRVFANRGLSGIDGTIASAAGVAAATGLPTLLWIGDLAFLHDLNSLHLLRHVEAPFVILLRNNDGGGIFRRLPIAAHEPPYTALFRMPHGMRFGAAAKQFNLRYFGYAQDAVLPEVLSRLEIALREPQPVLVEWCLREREAGG